MANAIITSHPILINMFDGIRDLTCVKVHKFKTTLKDCLFKNYIKEWK